MSFSDIYKKIFGGNKNTVRKTRLNPFGHDVYFDWEILVVSFIILFIVIFAAGSFFYYKVYTGQIFSGTTVQAQPVPPVDRIIFNRVLKFYDDKEKTFTDIQTNAPQLVDPSTSG